MISKLSPCRGIATIMPITMPIIIEGIAGTFSAMQAIIMTRGARAIGVMANASEREPIIAYAL